MRNRNHANPILVQLPQQNLLTRSWMAPGSTWKASAFPVLQSFQPLPAVLSGPHGAVNRAKAPNFLLRFLLSWQLWGWL